MENLFLSKLFLKILSSSLFLETSKQLHLRSHQELFAIIGVLLMLEAAFQRCSQEKVFWKHAASLQENTHPAEWF